jgi:hypothetical protein
MLTQVSHLLGADGFAQRDVQVRLSKIAVVLWDLIFQDEMVAEGVPSEFGNETVVLVQVMAGMREDQRR